MPKRRIERFYYRNGQIRMENREVGGQLHGLCRTWHYNGQLAEEQRYHHGKSHGLSQQWDEHGHLLGSFTMNHGTGRQRYWHNNGRLRSEINSLNGKFFGRMRIWLRDGTLVQETYYISNVDVTRAAYLKAARKYPDWPQHEGEPAGKVARDDQALKRKEHELFMESLLAKNSCRSPAMVGRGQKSRSSLTRKISHGKVGASFCGNAIRIRCGVRHCRCYLHGQTWKTICRPAVGQTAEDVGKTEGTAKDLSGFMRPTRRRIVAGREGYG